MVRDVSKPNAGRVPGPIGSGSPNPTSLHVGPMGSGLAPSPGASAKPFETLLDDAKEALAKASASRRNVEHFNAVPPASDRSTKSLKVVDWPLFRNRNTSPPLWDDFTQSNLLLGCALAAVLRSLALTPAGQAFINRVVTQVPKNKRGKPVSVELDYTKVTRDPNFVLPKGSTSSRILKDDRYFIVQVGGRAQKVSSVFYTDDSDGVVLLRYMKSPKDVLWASVIEKAYVQHLGTQGYAALEKFFYPARIWKDIVGKLPTQKHLARASNAEITRIADKANRIPTIATSKPLRQASSVTPDHGYSVHDYSRGKLVLSDPIDTKKVTMNIKEFRQNFTDFYYGMP
ncbi:MAG: hypothetical protein AAGG11_16965 [Pseudomonadota bacterium]